MEQKKTKILNYINVFRGLAILLIVMGHTMQFKCANPLFQQLNVELICGGTTLFIFISGFLFQHLSYKYEFKDYLSKKWSNVILPYLFTAILGIALCFMFPIAYGNSFDGLPAWLQIPMMLSVGRVHNIPTWFIPMIAIFFLCSYLLLFLERKNILYKLLPVLFLLTLVFNRHDVDYGIVQNLSYSEKYFAYVNYVLMGFVHFLSIYIFGMFCSKHKEIIDVFYSKRIIIWILMISTATLNVYSALHWNFNNGTISKIFLTILLLAYLKHYDEWLIAKVRLNSVLDFLAKYSFGLFFVHWYALFFYNQIFNLPKVTVFTGIETILFVWARFIGVTLISLFALWAFKKILLKINKNAKTRSFIGV